MDIPICHQGLSVEILRGHPIQIINLIRRTNIPGRIPMTIEAERHAQRFILADFIQFVNVAMAMNATDAAINVNGVIKEHKIGCFVNLNPRNGGVIRKALADRF